MKNKKWKNINLRGKHKFIKVHKLLPSLSDDFLKNVLFAVQMRRASCRSERWRISGTSTTRRLSTSAPGTSSRWDSVCRGKRSRVLLPFSHWRWPLVSYHRIRTFLCLMFSFSHHIILNISANQVKPCNDTWHKSLLTKSTLTHDYSSTFQWKLSTKVVYFRTNSRYL